MALVENVGWIEERKPFLKAISNGYVGWVYLRPLSVAC